MKSFKKTPAERSTLITYLFDLAKQIDFQRNYLGIQVSSNPNVKVLGEILDEALECLDEDSRRIIINDFKNKCNRLWWENHYSATTYYRLKAKAIGKFLDYLDIKS